jgi:hypothetical protein
LIHEEKSRRGRQCSGRAAGADARGQCAFKNSAGRGGQRCLQARSSRGVGKTRRLTSMFRFKCRRVDGARARPGASWSNCMWRLARGSLQIRAPPSIIRHHVTPWCNVTQPP